MIWTDGLINEFTIWFNIIICVHFKWKLCDRACSLPQQRMYKYSLHHLYLLFIDDHMTTSISANTPWAVFVSFSHTCTLNHNSLVVVSSSLTKVHHMLMKLLEVSLAHKQHSFFERWKNIRIILKSKHSQLSWLWLVCSICSY